MALSDIVNIQVSVESVVPSAAGFGEPLILSADYPGGFTQRVRHYTGSGPTMLAQLVTDGFSASGPTYQAVAAVMAQNPSVISVAVGKLVNKPTQHFTISPTYVAGANYPLTVDGNALNVAAITNLADTCTAIASAITALDIADLTATGTSTTVTIAMGTPGDFHTVAIGDQSLLSVVNDTPDAGITADLNAIALYDSTWYAVCADAVCSAAILALVAAWTESNLKLHVSQTIDTGCANNAHGTGSDIMQTLQSDDYARTALIYTTNQDSFAGAAWLGSRLPTVPGSENWMFAALVGVQPTPLTGTQVTNIKAKNGNYYYTVANGVNITANGQVASGSFIDLTRGRDNLVASLGNRLLTVLTANNSKIPYTDEGIAIIEGEVRAQMQQSIDQGFLSNNPAPVVTAPTAASAQSSDRANRILRGVTFQAQSAGAINNVQISGVVTL